MALTNCPYCGNPLVTGQTICDMCGQAVNNSAAPLRAQVNRQAVNIQQPQNTGHYRQPNQVTRNMGTAPVQQPVRHDTSRTEVSHTQRMTYNPQMGSNQFEPLQPFDVENTSVIPNRTVEETKPNELSQSKWTIGIAVIISICICIVVGGTFLFLSIFDFI